MSDSFQQTGRCYEDFEVGIVIRHPIGRTVSSTDNTWFTLLTVNTNPIHFDAHYAAQTEFGRPIVNSTLTLALVTGLTVEDVSRYAINLGWDEVRMPTPLFEGDTVYAETEVLSRRESPAGLFGQCLQADRLQIARHPVVEFSRRPRFLSQDLMHDHLLRSTEWQLAAEQFIEYDAETINIATAIDRVAVPSGLFRAHVGGGADNLAFQRQHHFGFLAQGKPEIHN